MTSKSTHEEADILRSGLYEEKIKPEDALRLATRIEGEDTAKRDIVFHVLQNDTSMEMLHMSLDVADTMKYPSPKFQVLSEIAQKCPNNFEQSVIIDYKILEQAQTVDGATAEKSEIIEIICNRENRMPMSLFNKMADQALTLYNTDCVPNAVVSLANRPECKPEHVKKFVDVVNNQTTDDQRKSQLLKQLSSAPVCARVNPKKSAEHSL